MIVVLLETKSNQTQVEWKNRRHYHMIAFSSRFFRSTTKNAIHFWLSFRINYVLQWLLQAWMVALIHECSVVSWISQTKKSSSCLMKSNFLLNKFLIYNYVISTEVTMKDTNLCKYFRSNYITLQAFIWFSLVTLPWGIRSTLLCSYICRGSTISTRNRSYFWCMSQLPDAHVFYSSSLSLHLSEPSDCFYKVDKSAGLQ